jgi:hypothetical protein
MLGAVSLWRGTPVYSPAATTTNAVLIAAGAALFVHQIHGFLTA